MCWRSHGTALNCTRWVTSCRHTHSRKSDGSTLQLALYSNDVRRDQQELAPRLIEELELAQHLAGQEPE